MALAHLGHPSPLDQKDKVCSFVRHRTLGQRLSSFGPDGNT